MELLLQERAGTWVIPFERILSAEDRDNLMLIERVRFINLQQAADYEESDVGLVLETARYDDSNLYLDVHTSYPMIIRFRFREQERVDSFEWYAVYHRGGGLLVFDKISRLKVSVERSGFEEPLLWG